MSKALVVGDPVEFTVNVIGFGGAVPQVKTGVITHIEGDLYHVRTSEGDSRVFCLDKLRRSEVV